MAKRQKKEEASEDKFIVLFTALSMILLAFFIMLNSMASMDQSRTRKVLDSLMGTFGPGLGASRSESGAIEGELITSPQAIKRELEDASQRLQGKHGAGWSVELRAGQIVVSLSELMLFDSGGHRLNPTSFPVLDELSALLKRTRYKLRVIGHSDGLKPKGRRSNWYYSAARASSVHRYLEDVGLVERGRIRSMGVAHTQPWPPAAREPGSPHHRRVELVILIPEARASGTSATLSEPGGLP